MKASHTCCIAGSDPSSSSKNAERYSGIPVERLAQMIENKNFTLVNVQPPYVEETPPTDVFIPFGEISDHLDDLPDNYAASVLEDGEVVFDYHAAG